MHDPHDLSDAGYARGARAILGRRSRGAADAASRSPAEVQGRANWFLDNFPRSPDWRCRSDALLRNRTGAENTVEATTETGDGDLDHAGGLGFRVRATRTGRNLSSTSCRSLTQTAGIVIKGIQNTQIAKATGT